MQRVQASTRSGSGNARMVSSRVQNVDGLFSDFSSLIVTKIRCRLKLKCDKSVPCSSCTRRGCPSICPNGTYSLICPFPGPVLPSSVTSPFSPHFLSYTLRMSMFNLLTRLYSSDACRKPRYRTRYTVRPYFISSRYGLSNSMLLASFLRTPTDFTIKSRG